MGLNTSVLQQTVVKTCSAMIAAENSRDIRFLVKRVLLGYFDQSSFIMNAHSQYSVDHLTGNG